MNRDTLTDRLAEVRRRIADHRDWLVAAPPVVVDAYAPPPPAEFNVEEENPNPNALCVPLPQDYDVC